MQAVITVSWYLVVTLVFALGGNPALPHPVVAAKFPTLGECQQRAEMFKELYPRDSMILQCAHIDEKHTFSTVQGAWK